MAKAIKSIRAVSAGSLPDIDLDFPDRDKPLIAKHLEDLYGEDKVTSVGVTLYFGIKLAVREVCRYYRIPFEDSLKLSSIMGDLEEMSRGGDWRDFLSELPKSSQDFIVETERNYPSLFPTAEKMVGLARQPGKHAAGYVIGPRSLAKELPVRKSENDEVISQFDKTVVERMGFLKADILGLRNLTTLSDARDLVESRTGERIDYYTLSESPDDDLTWSVFERGDTLEVFQMGGKGITDVAVQLRPRSISDLSTIVALYRPGVIGAGMLDEYISRAKGEKEVSYPCKEAEASLKDTYGICVYQEQAMQLTMDMAGFSSLEADVLRKAIGKKNMEKLMSLESKFVEGCQKNGIERSAAQEVFDEIKASGSYSFNRCLSGDTVLWRSSPSARDKRFPTRGITIEEVYDRWNSKTAVGEKYRSPKRGLYIMALDPDGRSRKARIKNVYQNGVKDVLEIRLADGKKVKATSNHRFLSECGYKMVSDLKVGDRLVVCDFEYKKERRGYSLTGENQGLSGHPTLEGHKGFSCDERNPGWIDGSFVKYSKYRGSFDGFCERCGKKVEGRYETHHKDGDRSNNEEWNLENLCVPCHKKAHYQMGRIRAGEKGYETSFSEIVSIEYVGEEMTYDVEMDTEEHNFFANGICSHNSHSVAYAYITYWTAYMKAHYPIEYYTACLMTVSHDKATPIIKEMRKRGISILPPSVSKIEPSYSILDERSVLFGLTHVKGVGEKAISKIMDGAPYSDFEDFVDRSKANSSVVKTLIRCGFFREWNANSRDLLHKYESGNFRSNLFDGMEEFGDFERAPYPDDIVAEIETEIFGMPLTVDPFLPYRKALGLMADAIEDFDEISSSPIGSSHVLLVRVEKARPHRIKSGTMGFLSFSTDKDDEFEATCFPSVFEPGRRFLQEGKIILIEVMKEEYRGRDSYVLNKIKSIDIGGV